MFVAFEFDHEAIRRCLTPQNELIFEQIAFILVWRRT